MKLVILNGSPKGENSVTYQYMRYIQKHLPHNTYSLINISNTIEKLEPGHTFFESTLKEISSADGILWVMPVYYYLIPSQMKRFIELVNEHGRQEVFSGKYAATILSSIHFFDHFAEHYLRGVSEDWGMYFFDSFSADMNDLFSSEKRAELITFARLYEECVKNKVHIPRHTGKLDYHKAELLLPQVPESRIREDKKVVLITDGMEEGSNLLKMARYFIERLPFQVKVVDLSGAKMVSGCSGCCKCGFENQCVFNDDVQRIIAEDLTRADGIIYALHIKDRYFSSLWKKFLDRSFVNNHIPVLKNKQTMLLVEGPLARLPDLKEIFVAMSEQSSSNFIGAVADDEPAEDIISKIDYFAKKMEWGMEKSYFKPPSFLGTGGTLIFRDLVFGFQGFIFKKDYEYYKREGLLNYPFRKGNPLFVNKLMGWMTNIKSFRKKMNSVMEQGMVKPYQKVVDQ